MKNLKIFVIGLVLLLGSAAKALDAKPYSIGLEAGVSFDSATTPDQISSSTKTGFLVGVDAEVKLVDILYIQPEFIYLHRSNSFVNAANVQLSVNYDSFEVPVFAKLKFGENIRPFLMVGPALIFNFSKSVSGSLGGAAGSVALNPRTVDFAGVAAAGLEVEGIFAQLRYTLGLVDMDQNSTTFQSRGFQILAGIQL